MQDREHDCTAFETQRNKMKTQTGNSMRYHASVDKTSVACMLAASTNTFSLQKKSRQSRRPHANCGVLAPQRTEKPRNFLAALAAHRVRVVYGRHRVGRLHLCGKADCGAAAGARHGRASRARSQVCQSGNGRWERASGRGRRGGRAAERAGLLDGGHALNERALRTINVVLARDLAATLDGSLVGDVQALALQAAEPVSVGNSQARAQTE